MLKSAKRLIFSEFFFNPYKLFLLLYPRYYNFNKHNITDSTTATRKLGLTADTKITATKSVFFFPACVRFYEF